MATTNTTSDDLSVDRGSNPVISYYLLTVSTGILLLVGMAVVLSSSSIHSIRQTSGNPYALFIIQAVALGMGLVAMIIGSRLKPRAWRHLGPIILIAAIALLVVVLFAGYSSGGNKAWIRVGLVTFQPSEVAKLGLAIYLGSVLGRRRKYISTFKEALVPAGVMAGFVLGLVLLGRDMGTATIVAFVVLAAYWVAGLPLRFFAYGSVAVVGVTILLFLAQGSRMRRLNTWLSSECDYMNDCWQQTHGTWALASGGVWGLGPGMSREKWGYLPAAENDYIFAIVGEEFGLIGTLLVVVAFAMMLIGINRIVTRSTDPFVQITAAAIGAWLIGQACVNIAVVLELLPVTGVPLPFVSSGGSSLIVSLAAMGVLMSFARHEPGAQEAFAARPSVIRKSLAVVTRGRLG